MKDIFSRFGYKLEINGSVFEHDGSETDMIYKGWCPWTVDHPDSTEKVNKFDNLFY